MRRLTGRCACGMACSAQAARCRECWRSEVHAAMLSRRIHMCGECGVARVYKRPGLAAIRCRSCASRMQQRNALRFDLRPVIARYENLSAASRATGLNRKLFQRARQHGVRLWTADRVCACVGLHVSELPLFERAS